MQWHTKQIFFDIWGTHCKESNFFISYYFYSWFMDIWFFAIIFSVFWCSSDEKIYYPLEFTQRSHAVSLLLNYWGYDTNLVKKKKNWNIHYCEILPWYHENFQWSMFYKLENTIIVSSCMLWSPQCKTRTSNNNIKLF